MYNVIVLPSNDLKCPILAFMYLQQQTICSMDMY